MKNTKVISAFPGTGKTYCFNNFKGITILDSDSSEFSWIKDENGNNTTERNPDFPNNYIKHIKENIGKVDIIFVSSHSSVREALTNEGINFILVFPNVYNKNTYLKRYKDRGSSDSFIKLMDDKFEEFCEEMYNDKKHKRIIFYGDETISDLLEFGFCNALEDEHPACIARNGYDIVGCNINCLQCDHITKLI